ncbi:hypothetical protein G4228_011815 [Cervus hanglu yarkandensis]|nr:hypothetical protein G4228_011815 [Cervus hanglu yarkandensis]
MDSLFVEEVAASLVREFLSRKAKENPLKTNLELITRYFLDHFENIGNNVTQETPIPALSLPKKSNKLPWTSSETALVNIYDLADEDESWRTSLSEISKARKNQLSVSNKVEGDLDVLQLEDVEDELVREEIILSPVSSMLKLQVVSKPIDLSVAKDIKTILFGSSFCCFNEEWKLQSFSFNDSVSLKYGIVQNKAGTHACPSLQGGPCGVLAAVQGCVLQKLLFEGDSSSDCARLQPSNARRTHCLALAIADIVWRAGGRERAVVTLASGTQHFSPTGKYKADGILETLILHSLTCYEELVTFLQQSIHQFEAGPYGCVLLTLSAILSRSTELVRQDFDVPTSHLIGAHGYCTQELVNLLLTGKAVSNVFNDVVELDSGNGNITLLKGISSRSDIGFLSLFEHYNVCQVGCFLKTPRFPIWVVCSESHFSVLFSQQLELLRDWRIERLFDLYYYDGLANQQEQIRLTVDTTQTVPEDRDNSLVPPLELCIRTKSALAALKAGLLSSPHWYSKSAFFPLKYTSSVSVENLWRQVEGRISGLEWLGTHPVTLCGDELMAPPLITRGDGGALGLRDKSGPAPEPALPQKCPKPACLFHEGPAGERLGPSALLCSPSQLSCDCQGRLVGPLLPFLCIPP